MKNIRLLFLGLILVLNMKSVLASDELELEAPAIPPIVLIPSEIVKYLFVDIQGCFNEQTLLTPICINFFTVNEECSEGASAYTKKECIYQEYFEKKDLELVFKELLEVCQPLFIDMCRSKIIEQENLIKIGLTKLAETLARYIKVGGRWVKWP